jgi:hypothetical protein
LVIVTFSVARATPVAALQADPVVERRVDRHVREPHVAAGVHVDAVAVRVHLHIVDRQVVDAGREDREVSAVPDRNVPDGDVAAVLERDRLVARAGGELALAIG